MDVHIGHDRAAPEQANEVAAETSSAVSTRARVERELQSALIQGLAGDASAYRVFLDRLSRHLRAHLSRHLPKRRDDVEDVLQETLLAIHHARHTYRAAEPLTAWVHAIARYKLMDYFRRHGRREGRHDPLYDDALWTESETEASDAHRDLGQLLATLPDNHRVPIQLVKIEGLTVAEAAQASGLSESAVKVGIHRGLKALAARMRAAA